ncbi:ABC transporter ATP-binding protein [Actinokineospora sp. G85]|uniref:ABC transporter ATP-binding protein n=1 Tax=Actinokineospora sp. G85 TaxID=3406626 RepID=UPI003C78F237
MTPAYSVEALVLTYPGQDRPAVDAVSFSIAEGEVFGLLGDNGAGKSTVVRQLVTLLRPTSGRVALFGVDIAADPGLVARTVGYMPQSSAALNRLTAAESVYFAAHLRGLSRRDARRERDELLGLWGIDEVAGRSSARLSGGQRRLLQLAVAMAGRRPVLILDEPTNDLDPVRRKHVWSVLRRRNAELGTTIVLVTHDAVEAEKAIQRVGILRRGRFTAIGTPAELRRGIEGALRVELAFPPDDPPALPEGVTPRETGEGRWLLLLDNADAGALVARLDPATTDIRLSSTTLEDLYLHYAA